MARLPWSPRSVAGAVVRGVLVGTLAACASTALVEVPPPNAVADPSVVTTATGATQLYAYALARWAANTGGSGFSSSGNQVTITGLFTDELLRVQGGPGSGLDERNDGSIVGLGSAYDYGNTLNFGFSSIRNNSRQARDALALYAPNGSPALRSRLLNAEAYSIVGMAEALCSGVPLSILPLQGGAVLTRGFSTDEMLGQALALFDSATTLAGDSTRFRYLADVGKGRALLDLGRFVDATTAVAEVPTDFVYLLEANSSTSYPGPNLIGNKPQNFQVVDREGSNGLVWSTDPRTAIVTTPGVSGAMLVPGKYLITGGAIVAGTANPNASTRAADGLEARLIEAEAALAVGDANWLTKLNALRSACVGTTPCAPVPGLTAAALPPLADPGTANARLDLLMKERAMWLYLTGHRQGDLRRLAHQYHRDPLTLWPTGLYVNPGFSPLIQPATDNGTVSYANVYVFQLNVFGSTTAETVLNPLYSGCNDLNP